VTAVEDLAYGLDVAGLDPAALGGALASAGAKVAQHPERLAHAAAGLAREQAEVALGVVHRLLGANGGPQAAPEPGDRRFADRAWRDNPFLDATLKSYLVSSAWARRLLESAELSEPSARKARFALELLVDAAAPSNLPWLNPAVVKEAIDTGGLSLARGFANFVGDVVENGGMPRQIDRSKFEVGRDLATTPGRVVLRNDLIELIAYEPQTETVFAQPLVYSPPWINKYYVMDLAPGRSFIEHAVQRGFTVFAISYRNPDSSMAELTLDDYLRDGFFAALDRAQELTGSETVNVEAVCLGGTLAMIGLAVLGARGKADRVGWATLNNTLVDFSEPGLISVFTDEETIERIERRTRRRGYLDAQELSGPFTWMRGNDLVWNYVISGWFMGKEPPAFDILAWNADATRLPARMHSQYLRACYLRNELVEPGAFEIDGTALDLSKVTTPLYVLSAERDHIAPWRSAYRTTQLVSGETRHVLTSGGHIAGMVNPPGPKASHRVNSDTPASAEEWLEGSELVQGSWWDDWAEWASARSGDRVAPPKLPDGEPAPGQYVRG
jgi:poly[(R)-3-hydroxyalkanoate] polymerase subunit PhaC